MRYLAFWGRHNYFVFIGDSRIRNQYQSFLNHLTGHIPQQPSLGNGYHENQTFHDTQLKLTVDFIWSPYVSEVMVNMFRMWMVSAYSDFETNVLSIHMSTKEMIS